MDYDAQILFEEVCEDFLSDQLQLATPPIYDLECAVVGQSFAIAEGSLKADVEVTGEVEETAYVQEQADVLFQEMIVDTFNIQGDYFVEELKEAEEEDVTTTYFQSLEEVRGIVEYDGEGDELPPGPLPEEVDYHIGAKKGVSEGGDDELTPGPLPEEIETYDDEDFEKAGEVDGGDELTPGPLPEEIETYDEDGAEEGVSEGDGDELAHAPLPDQKRHYLRDVEIKNLPDEPLPEEQFEETLPKEPMPEEQLPEDMEESPAPLHAPASTTASAPTSPTSAAFNFYRCPSTALTTVIVLVVVIFVQ